jgi:hypothetical protein
MEEQDGRFRLHHPASNDSVGRTHIAQVFAAARESLADDILRSIGNLKPLKL